LIKKKGEEETERQKITKINDKKNEGSFFTYLKIQQRIIETNVQLPVMNE
jgi:hypothetical protein